MKGTNQDPFALTSDGNVLLNAMEFSNVGSLDEALSAAKRHGRVVFVGVQLTYGEAREALDRMMDTFSESASVTAYAREHRQRRD